MKELTNEKTLTTKELAEKLKTSSKVILENAKKCLPNKIIKNGKPTFWNKAEITVLLDFIKSNNNRTDLTFTTVVKATDTELTPALKIKKAFDLMQEGYEEELAILRAKNLEQQKLIDRIADGKGCFSIAQTAKALKLPYGRNTLFEKLKEMRILNPRREPYQEQVNNGHFIVVVKTTNVGNKSVTLTTGKGLVYLAKRFNAEIDQSVKADF